MEWWDVWRRLDPRGAIRQDVREGIEFHIEGRIRDRVDRGWDEDAARAHVPDNFGDVASVEALCRAYDVQRVYAAVGVGLLLAAAVAAYRAATIHPAAALRGE